MTAGRVPENPILLVDDEQGIIDGLSLMLKSNAVAACSIWTACSALRTKPTRFSGELGSMYDLIS